jgi:hypothetical protein
MLCKNSNKEVVLRFLDLEQQLDLEHEIQQTKEGE